MIFSKTLIRWYSKNKRILPWRETKNPYYIWLSEIILQQTQVKQGLPYYESFVTSYPTVFDLANAEESDVLKLWQGLGYYSRARNLHASAKHIAYDLNGVFPDTYKDLLKLRGVGDYTASAIASICFNEATAVVDGNVYRALSRYFGIDTPINSSKGQKEFKALAQELIDIKKPADFNQAIMEFGAIQCKPKNPECSACSFRNSCVAFGNNRVSDLPVKIKSAKAKKEKNSPQIVKALLYSSKYAMTLEEDAQLKIVNDFKSEIKKASFPTKNVLESYLANIYWQFFQNHRYQFYNRTKTEAKVDLVDFRTWDLTTLFHEIDIHFEKSLENVNS